MEKGRILLIEPNKADREAEAALLKKEGYIVAIAATGKEALGQLKEGEFDLIIIEIMLPDIKGEELCSLIRRKRQYRYTPIFILSVEDEVEEIERLLEGLADEYIIKPPRPAYLLGKIKSYLNRRQ